ncbi:MAG: hypothetical protein ACRCX4_12425 [Bacteroidales bacterium]
MKHLIILWVMTLFFLACSEEKLSTETIYSGNMELSIGTEINSSVSQQLIRKRRMMIFQANTGVIICNQSVTYPSSGIDIIPVFTLKIKPGAYDLITVCNETSELTPILNNITNKDQIATVMLKTPGKEEELVIAGHESFMIKAIENNPERPAISLDNGITWKESGLTVTLHRIASKFTLRMRRITDNVSDRIIIREVDLINLADYAYLKGQPYLASLSEKKVFSGNIELQQNEPYTSITQDIILNEYLLPNIQDDEKGAAFRISASYTRAGSTPVDVIYLSPVTGADAPDYSLKRNHHYRVDATIRQIGEIEYAGSAEYDITDWESSDDGNVNIGGVITVAQKEWAEGTLFNPDGSIDIMANSSITFEFGMASPEGARWTAMLSNHIDFEFDLSGDGEREGISKPGVIYNIRIRPKRIISSLEGPVTTEFYILVDNGSSIEPDINNDDKTGRGNRFVIKQRPSS